MHSFFNSSKVKRARAAAWAAVCLGCAVLPAPAAEADYLIIDGSGGESTETVTLNGAQSANRRVYRCGGMSAAGGGSGDYVAAEVTSGRNTVENSGNVQGTIAVKGGQVSITNRASGVLGQASGDGFAVDALREDSAPDANITLHNYGTVNGGVGAQGALNLVNRGTITGAPGKAAVQLARGTAVVENYGTLRAGAGADGSGGAGGGETPGETLPAVYVGEDDSGEGGTGDLPDDAPVTRTLDLYHRPGGRIEGDICNQGTLNVRDFRGTMNGNIVNTGTLRLSTSKARFAGSYVSAAEGENPARAALEIDITDGSHGQLYAEKVAGDDASGIIDISGTDVKVNTRGGIAGDRYTVLHAENGLVTVAADPSGDGAGEDPSPSAAGIIINDNSLTLDYVYETSPQDLTIKAYAKPHAFVNNSLKGDRKLGDLLDREAVSVPQSMRSLMWRLNTIRTAPEMRRALESVNARVSQNSQTQLMLSAVAQHMTAAKELFRELGANKLAEFSQGTLPARASAGGIPISGSGLTGDGEYYRWHSFGRLYGGFGKQEDCGASTGYDFRHLGAMAGLDFAFARELRAGVIGSFSYNNSEINRKLGENRDLLTRAGLYGSFNWDGAYIDVSPTFGLHRIKSERRVHVGGWSTTAENERWAWDVNLLLNAGLTINLPGRCYFTPEFSLSPSFFHSPEFRERGAAENFNLRQGSYNQWSLLQVMNFKFGSVIDLGCGNQIRPEFGIGWEHEYLDPARDVSCAFVAAPDGKWRNDFTGADRDRLLLTLGVSALVMDNLSIYGRWEQRIWGDGYSCAFSGGAAYDF